MLQWSVQAVSVSDEAPRVALRPVEKRKEFEIEAALQWTYRDQMPKDIGRAHWTTRSQSLESYGSRIDNQSIDVGFPSCMGEPHPDALKIHAAVHMLPEAIGLEWAASRASLMPDLLGWVSASDPTLSAMVFKPMVYVQHYARMGTRPRWNLGATKVVRVLGKNGKPLLQFIDHEGNLVEGRTTARHYGSGARCVCRLDPPAREIACARAEYFVWRSALSDVANTLRAWKLRDHVVTPPVAAAEPWIVDTEMRSRILRSER